LNKEERSSQAARLPVEGGAACFSRRDSFLSRLFLCLQEYLSAFINR